LVRILRRWQLIDRPGSAPHKRHSRPVPLAGGLVLLATMLIVGALGGLFQDKENNILFFPSLIVFFFGLIDDWKNLRVIAKLFGQIVAAVLLIYAGVYVQLFNNLYVNWLITLVWVVGITNAYNFIDSMDGLASGLGCMAAAFFMMVAYDAGQISLSVFCAVLLGACAGVYFYNLSPARLFIGDSGAQWIGFILAGIGIAYTPEGFLREQSWFVPVLLVGVPLFDMGLVVFSRLRRGRPVYQANLDHTYHRLVARGLAPNRAVALMHVTGGGLGCLAFITLRLTPIWANLIYAFCIFTGITLILWLDRKPKR